MIAALIVIKSFTKPVLKIISFCEILFPLEYPKTTDEKSIALEGVSEKSQLFMAKFWYLNVTIKVAGHSFGRFFTPDGSPGHNSGMDEIRNFNLSG